MVKALTAEEIEGNRLIAIWMGAKIGNPVGRTEVLINVPDFYSNRTTSTHATKDLQYHKRWDWIMPVVQKILSLEMKSFDVYVLHLEDSLRTANIMEVWEATIDFLKYHNPQPA